MVNKVYGRKLSARHIEYRKLAETAEMGTVSRGQLIGLARKLEMAGLIKERNKQKREVMYNLHYLKNIALGAFESHKAELKGGGNDRKWLHLYACISSLN